MSVGGIAVRQRARKSRHGRPRPFGSRHVRLLGKLYLARKASCPGPRHPRSQGPKYPALLSLRRELTSLHVGGRLFGADRFLRCIARFLCVSWGKTGCGLARAHICGYRSLREGAEVCLYFHTSQCAERAWKRPLQRLYCRLELIQLSVQEQHSPAPLSHSA